ncbi:MAG: sensor domain-containing diguanylate cyclase [Parvibaculaceae bacterium]|nr:sensor domain-containing diguanylate cyclase [Parvibaculaceae bacterium]
MSGTNQPGIYAGTEERARLETLGSYEILDTSPEQSFDRITRLARAVFDVPLALVTLVDSDRLWFKARAGLNIAGLPRIHSFCNETIKGNAPLILRDVLRDGRFDAFPLVSGDTHVRFYAGIPLTTPDGFNIGTLSVMDREPRDILPSQTELLEDLARTTVDALELRQLASTDSLTGAMTRRAFIANAEREISRSSRYGNPLSFIMFDLDNGREINERHGHPVGDAVLRALIKTTLTQLRTTDYLGRLGGQHFVICLPETFHENAALVAERLCSTVAGTFTTGETTFPVSASFGVSTWRGGEISSEPALARAEQALHAAKQGGRNQVVSI